MCGCLKRAALAHHLTLSLTGEARAVAEVQVLHAFGEDECTDITCGKEGGEKEEGGDSEERRTVCGCLKRVDLTLSPNSQPYR